MIDNMVPTVATAITSVAVLLLIMTRPSIVEERHKAVLEYRVYLQDCLKQPSLDLAICDTIWDKAHGWPQGPL